MQPIATLNTAASLVQREDSCSLSSEQLDKRIQELIEKEKLLEGSLASLPTQSPAAMIHHFNQINHKLHLTRETPPPEHILPFLQQALRDTHRELYHHQQERIHRPFPLQQLSPELLGLVIEKTEPSTKASLVQVSKPILRTTLWVTKTEIATLFSTLITSLQETLPLLAIHDESATKKTLLEISEIDTETIRDAMNFANIHQEAMALRNKIAKALFLLAKEDIKVANDLLLELLHQDNIECNSAEKELEILQKMLEIAMITDDGQRSEQCFFQAQKLLQQQDLGGALLLRTIADDTRLFYQSQITYAISDTLAKKGDFERALTLTKSMEPTLQSGTYSTIASWIPKKESLANIFSLFERIIGPDPDQREKWSFAIARAKMEQEEMQESLDLLTTLPDKFEKDLIYMQLAFSQPNISVAERVQLAERIRDPGMVAWTRGHIYVKLIQEGIQTNNSRKIERALRRIQEIKDPIARNGSLQEAARQFAESDQKEQAYKVAEKIDEVRMRAWTKNKIKQILKEARS